VTRVEVAHTSAIDAATLAAAQEVVTSAFPGDFTEIDWKHALGGVHAIAYDGDELIGHASVVQRVLLHRGDVLRAGYVEGVGVRRDRQRGGVGGSVMDAIGDVIRRAYDLGALSSTDAGVRLYESRGWELWRGPVSALTPSGIERTPEDDRSVYVLPVAGEIDLDGELTCDWRDGDLW
jgi:aminoglycoside 2'-N-acetyltransferase I